MSLAKLTSMYADTPEAHQAMWDECLRKVQATPYLKAHRDFVEEGVYGYGERPFNWLWQCLVQEMPQDFTFLEIGVFQGQSLSLVQLIAKKLGKGGTFYGLSPLDTTGDLTLKHPDMDYVRRISEMHVNFDLQFPKLIKGLSYDPRRQEFVRQRCAPIHLLFVDGCHDLEVAVDDIEVYGKMVAPGGYIVVDDACNDLKIPDGMIKDNWRGIPSVTKAVQQTLLQDPEWKFLFSVGHQKCFQKVAA